MQTRHQPKSKMPIAPSEPGSSSQRQPAPDRFSLAALETVVDRIAERWRQENDDNDTLRTHFGTTWSIEVWAEDFKAASRGEHDNLTQQRKLWKEQKEEWRRRWLNRLNSLLESDHLSTDIYSSKFPAFERLKMSIRPPDIFQKIGTSWVKKVTSSDVSRITRQLIRSDLRLYPNWESALNALYSFEDGALNVHHSVEVIANAISNQQEVTDAILNDEGTIVVQGCLEICRRAHNEGTGRTFLGKLLPYCEVVVQLIKELAELREQPDFRRAHTEITTPAVSQVFVPQNRRAGDVQSYVDAEARLHPIEDDPQDDRDLVPRIDRIAKKYATHRRDQTEKDAREALDALLYSCSSHDLNLFRWLLNGLERLHESQMPIPRGLPSTAQELEQLWTSSWKLYKEEASRMAPSFVELDRIRRRR